MAFVITLTFDYEINASVQVGDNVYHSIPEQKGGFNVVDNNNPPVHVGEVYSILSTFQMEILSTYENPPGTPIIANYPTSSSYISFSKDGVVNQNELLGYYATTRFENNSTKKAKLFAVATEVTENSK